MGRGGAEQERTNEEEAWVEEELQLVGVEEEESSTVSSPLSPSSSLVFPQAFFQRDSVLSFSPASETQSRLRSSRQ